MRKSNKTIAHFFLVFTDLIFVGPCPQLGMTLEQRDARVSDTTIVNTSAPAPDWVFPAEAHGHETALPLHVAIGLGQSPKQ